MCWSEMPDEVRSKSVGAAALTLAQIVRLVTRLQEDPGDLAALRELLQRFAGLAGWGGLHGLAPISVAAQLGEHDCATLLGGNIAPERRHLEQITALIHILRRELRKQEEPAVEPADLDSLDVALPPRAGVLAVGPWGGLAPEARRLLLEQGMAVEWVETSYEAGRVLAAQGPPDAMIAAAQLPDGTGYVLTDYLRSLAGGSDTVVVIAGGETGDPADPSDPAELVRCGADAAIEDPPSWPALAAKLACLLARRDAAEPRILCLADDAREAVRLRELLDAAGYRVRCCTDSRRLPREMASFAPELLLLDVPEPDWSTSDLVRRIRLDRRAAVVPLLFLTAAGAADCAPRAIGAEYLARPVEAPRLLAAVASRIERTRALKKLFASENAA